LILGRPRSLRSLSSLLRTLLIIVSVFLLQRIKAHITVIFSSVLFFFGTLPKMSFIYLFFHLFGFAKSIFQTAPRMGPSMALPSGGHPFGGADWMEPHPPRYGGLPEDPPSFPYKWGLERISVPRKMHLYLEAKIQMQGSKGKLTCIFGSFFSPPIMPIPPFWARFG